MPQPASIAFPFTTPENSTTQPSASAGIHTPFARSYHPLGTRQFVGRPAFGRPTMS
jgi:hypothetical protein